MKTIVTVVVGLLITVHSFCQKPREVTIRPGQTASSAFPIKDKYRYPNFHDGFLITPEGKKSQPLKLNFNVFSGLPQFINEKGDTLFLDEHIAKYVQIKETTYLHNSSKDYYELILNTVPIRLAIEREWRIARVETVYDGSRGGKESISFSRDTQNAVYSPTLGRMVRNENTVFERDSSYFFIDAKEKIYKANESNLLRLFADHKKQINDRLSQESIDFKKEEELKKLFQFCLSLAQVKP